MLGLYADYPFTALGDAEGEEAPVRSADLLSYDGDKYRKVLVEGVAAEAKTGYFYTSPGRYGEVSTVGTRCIKEELPNG